MNKVSCKVSVNWFASCSIILIKTWNRSESMWSGREAITFPYLCEQMFQYTSFQYIVGAKAENKQEMLSYKQWRRKAWRMKAGNLSQANVLGWWIDYDFSKPCGVCLGSPGRGSDEQYWDKTAGHKEPSELLLLLSLTGLGTLTRGCNLLPPQGVAVLPIPTTSFYSTTWSISSSQIQAKLHGSAWK